MASGHEVKTRKYYYIEESAGTFYVRKPGWAAYRLARRAAWQPLWLS